MSSDEQNGADVNVEVAGQKVAIRNVKSLNTLATVATLIVVICGFTIGWNLLDAHAKGGDKREEALTVALKELARSHREASRDQVKEQRMLNCLIVADQKDRRRAFEDCERISR